MKLISSQISFCTSVPSGTRSQHAFPHGNFFQAHIFVRACMTPGTMETTARFWPYDATSTSQRSWENILNSGVRIFSSGRTIQLQCAEIFQNFYIAFCHQHKFLSQKTEPLNISLARSLIYDGKFLAQDFKFSFGACNLLLLPPLPVGA